MFQHNNPPFAKKLNCDSNPPPLLRTMLEKRASICMVCDLNSDIVKGGGDWEIPLKLVKSTN